MVELRLANRDQRTLIVTQFVEPLRPEVMPRADEKQIQIQRSPNQFVGNSVHLRLQNVPVIALQAFQLFWNKAVVELPGELLETN